MNRAPRNAASLSIVISVFVSSVSCTPHIDAQVSAKTRVELLSIAVDPKNPERKQFGSLTILSAFQLQSKDQRFGGLSGLSLGSDDRLYAVSDRGYWLSTKMVTDSSGALVNLVDWQIAPLLTPARTPVTGSSADAEALALTQNGAFLVGFEGRHRIWRYDPPPETFESIPVPLSVPTALRRAPSNGGLEGLTSLPNGRLLALTEEFANPDGSFKGWLIDGVRFEELSYLPAKGFRVTDCAALKNGDVLVLERRYVPLGILSTRVTLVNAKALHAGAKLSGKELLRLEQPFAVENFEGIAVQQTAKGTMIYLVSDDNYNPFQQTLLLQFLLTDSNH